ncbi:MAG: BMP family protein [Oscillibacter sp.]|nr:BMP family protein [Oscillibacter sp.]
MKKILAIALVLVLACCVMAQAEPTSMALSVSGPANDQGWNAVAVAGLEATAAKFGLTTTIIENVGIADSEAVYRQLAVEGYDIIIGHGYQYGEPAVAVSEEFPDKYFFATESDCFSENGASYVMACEQGAYIMGLLCASMSESKIIGVIGGFEQPSITKELEAYKLAAAAVDPEIQVLSIYINSFTDTNLGYEAAMALINQGADVVYQVANQAGNGALKACEEKGVYCCGNSYDQNSIAPDYVLSSTIYNMDQVMITAVSSIMDGTFEGGVYNLGMDKNVVEIAPYHALDEKIPQEVKDLINDSIAKIISGELEIPVISTPTK